MQTLFECNVAVNYILDPTAQNALLFQWF